MHVSKAELQHFVTFLCYQEEHCFYWRITQRRILIQTYGTLKGPILKCLQLHVSFEFGTVYYLQKKDFEPGLFPSMTSFFSNLD